MEGFNLLLAQSVDPGTGLSTLFTQLGVFAVVVVVFKFMLNRQDNRDAKDDVKDAEILALLRQELISERQSHDETRQKLYDALAKLSHIKEHNINERIQV